MNVWHHIVSCGREVKGSLILIEKQLGKEIIISKMYYQASIIYIYLRFACSICVLYMYL
ncbi:mCG147158 [Mus musculus]|nr:mCG147158 [Mus musculus]